MRRQLSDRSSKKLKKKPQKRLRLVLKENTNHDAPTAVIINRSKTMKDQKLILSALSKHFIFTGLCRAEKLKLIEQMRCYSVKPNEFIFNQNKPGTHFFIVASGCLQVIVNNEPVKELGPSDNFGELALLHDTLRSASIKTLDHCILWGMDRSTFQNALNSINKHHFKENKAFVKLVPVFSALSPEQKNSLLANISEFKFRANETIVREGDSGDLFYMIKEGRVACTQNGELIREMHRGDFFGEQALLRNSVRTATITAITSVRCLAIGRERLDYVLGHQFHHIVFKNSIRIALDQSPMCKDFTPKQKERLAGSFNFSQVEAGTKVGEKHFQMLMKGTAVCNAETVRLYELYPTANFLAVENCEVAVLERKDFLACVSGESKQELDQLSLLKKVQVFRGLPMSKLGLILQAMQSRTYADGDCIVRQYTEGDSFYIIKSGQVNIIKNKSVIRSITHLDYFGERSLLYNEKRTASVVASGPVECWELHKRDFLEIFDRRLRGFLIERIELQDDSIKLSDLAVVRLIGNGSFGKVYHVVHKKQNTHFALKCVNRELIDSSNMQNSIKLERKILMELDHVFIVKLVKTFKDEKRLYFLMELVLGEELFEVLRHLDTVSEAEAKFYSACLVLVIEHLHERNIVYRDLKPENIMIDRSGYPKLIDFGISKILRGRTYSVIGTPHYMAPEIVTGKGHSLEVDWYALGVIIYEFMFGNVPFGANHENPYNIYQEALFKDLVIEEGSRPFRDIVYQLLDKNPANRIKRGVNSLKNHPWFNGIIWDQLILKENPAPYQIETPNLDSSVKAALSVRRRLSEIFDCEDVSDNRIENEF